MINLRSYSVGNDGVAGVEAALLLPVLMTMLLGVYDLGHAVTANHKMITATQVIADLVARNAIDTDNDVNQAIEAGTLAMTPYVADSNGFGIDIVSVQFDGAGNPQVVWRKTVNMTADDSAVTKSTGLGSAGEGAMVITMIYDYKPTFGTSIIPAYRMRETAYSRGRRTSIVTHQ